MSVFEELKTVAKTLQEVGKIEQYQQILEIQEKLLGMQKKIFELEEKNKKLQDEKKIEKNLVYTAEVYYLREGGKEDGPFCALCYDTKKLLVRMTDWNDNSKKCQNCGKVYLFK